MGANNAYEMAQASHDAGRTPIVIYLSDFVDGGGTAVFRNSVTPLMNQVHSWGTVYGLKTIGIGDNFRTRAICSGDDYLYFMRDEFPELDMDRVIRMCLIHDLGECFTGDIPTFLKTAGDEAEEERLLYDWVASLPAPYDRELREMYEEMAERKTPEAKLYKALDGLEAVIQHNEADISTWEPHEYELNLNYCVDRCAFSPYLSALRALVREETVRKIEESESDIEP